jgi:hypothetical protein
MAENLLRSPLAAWLSRFASDYWIYPGAWVWGAWRSLAAIPQTLLTQTPRRAQALGRHLLAGWRGSLKWARGERAFSLEDFGMWGVRLLCKSADLLCLGEMLNAAGMLLKHNSRPLRPAEMGEARRVFGSSLDYSRVRLDEWSLVAHVGNWVYEGRTGRRGGHMALTLCNTIHFSRRIQPNPADMAWLIHELTHVAQYQYAGSQFIPEALLAQARAGYDYGGPAALGGRDFASFNREQQGEIALDYYNHLRAQKLIPPGAVQDYARLAAQLRAGEL